jgi:RNA polymerase sigma-70 factor, ECF subfamily
MNQMSHEPIVNGRLQHDAEVAERFLNTPSEESFTALFEVFSPQLFSYFRARRCAPDLAEDLIQEVMLKVYRKAGQIRDRRLFRGWLFKIASNTLLIHYDKRSREVETVDVAGLTDRLAAAASSPSAGPVASEFHDWMALLNARERELMTLRYIEDWEYHEIAAAQAVPIGTVQWRIFKAKQKLAPHLTTSENPLHKAA